MLLSHAVRSGYYAIPNSTLQHTHYILQHSSNLKEAFRILLLDLLDPRLWIVLEPMRMVMSLLSRFPADTQWRKGLLAILLAALALPHPDS